MEHAPAAPAALVVEDNPALLTLLTKLLAAEGYRATGASDAAGGLRHALADPPALVLLDVGLPDGNGVTLAAELRRRGLDCPILMLTAHDAVHERVAGLEAGADDYVVKPFDSAELLARVRALRRRSVHLAESAGLRVGDITLDPVHRVARRGDRTVPLTQREYSLLAVLMRHADEAVSRQTLAVEAWDQPPEAAAPRPKSSRSKKQPKKKNIVDVYIAYLRRKLTGPDGRSPLHTVRGVGYVLRAADAGRSDAPRPPRPPRSRVRRRARG